jgi:hypothetical protein
MAQRYSQPPSRWLNPSTEDQALGEPACTTAVLWRLQVDLGVFLLGMEEDERQHLERDLKRKHGF